MSMDVASHAVHSSLYLDAGANTEQVLRQGQRERLQKRFPQAPARILDLHSTVGLSTFRREEAFPTSHAITQLSRTFVVVVSLADFRATLRLTWTDPEGYGEKFFTYWNNESATVCRAVLTRAKS
jgi:hypothetical protein